MEIQNSVNLSNQRTILQTPHFQEEINTRRMRIVKNCQDISILIVSVWKKSDEMK